MAKVRKPRDNKRKRVRVKPSVKRHAKAKKKAGAKAWVLMAREEAPTIIDPSQVDRLTETSTLTKYVGTSKMDVRAGAWLRIAPGGSIVRKKRAKSRVDPANEIGGKAELLGPRGKVIARQG